MPPSALPLRCYPADRGGECCLRSRGRLSVPRPWLHSAFSADDVVVGNQPSQCRDAGEGVGAFQSAVDQRKGGRAAVHGELPADPCAVLIDEEGKAVQTVTGREFLAPDRTAGGQ